MAKQAPDTDKGRDSERDQPHFQHVSKQKPGKCYSTLTTWLQSILDLRILNRALHKVFIHKCIISCIRAPRLVCSDQPEGHVLPCLDLALTQTFPAVFFRGSGVPIQIPLLWAVPVSPCLHQSCKECFCPIKEM